MARVDILEFDEKAIARVYVARTVAEGEDVEQVLSEKGVDFAIEVESFWGVGVASTPANGAVFYVLAGQAGFCKEILKSRGLSAGVIGDDVLADDESTPAGPAGAGRGDPD